MNSRVVSLASKYYSQGEKTWIQGDYRTSLSSYSRALDLYCSCDNMFEKARCLRRLGDLHYHMNSLDKSMEFYLDARKVFQQIADESDSAPARLHIGHIMATIGNVLNETGDLKDALNYYRKCYDIYVQEGFSRGIPGVLQNIGIVLQRRGKLHDALEAYENAVGAAEESDDPYLASVALNNTGSILMDTGDLNAAGECFDRALGITEEQGRKKGTLSVLLNLIELRRLQKRTEEAEEMCSSAETIALSLEDDASLASVLKSRALICRDRSDYRLALETYIRYQELREQVLSEKRTRHIDVLRLRYETEAREVEIEGLKRERTLNRTMAAVSAAGLALTGISLLFAYRNVRFRKRANRELRTAYSKVEKLSRTDPLTGLANRREMTEKLTGEKARFDRNGSPYSLILADIDNFKSINDRFGHAFGDRVLQGIADILSGTLRRQDLAARWGGEEFLLLLPDTGLEAAEKVADKIRKAMSTCRFRSKSARVPVKLTFGVAQGGPESIDRTVRNADEALYRGKEQGRDRIVTHEGRR